MKLILTCFLLLLPLLLMAKEPEPAPRAALIRLQADMQQTGSRSSLSASEKLIVEDALRDLATLTAKDHKESKEDRRRVTNILDTAEPLLDSASVSAPDREALRRDFKALNVPVSERANSRHRLRDSIQPDRQDAAAYPDASPASQSGDNSTHGGWRRAAPQP